MSGYLTPEPKDSKDIVSSSWSETDTEKLFANLGRYLVIFQVIEGVLDQILLLIWGHENWTESQSRLAKMKNYEKVEAVRESVAISQSVMRCHTRPEWCASFAVFIEQLHKERERRNRIMHSQILFDFVEAGFPPLMSNRRKVAGQVDFDRQYLTEDFWKNLFEEVGKLTFDVGFYKTQLIHDHEAQISTYYWWDGATRTGEPYNEIISGARSGSVGRLRMQFIGGNEVLRAKEVECCISGFSLKGLTVRALINRNEAVTETAVSVPLVRLGDVLPGEFQLELRPA